MFDMQVQVLLCSVLLLVLGPNLLVVLHWPVLGFQPALDTALSALVW